jgi:hypothetical protein
MMEFVLLLSRLLVASVFVVAAYGKFTDRAGSRQALLDFGLHERAAALLAIGLPLTEAIIALVLLGNRTAPWGAAAAQALLTIFLFGIGWNLLRGRRPQCHCFGRLHSEPIGTAVVIRNVLLVAAAGFIAWSSAGAQSAVRALVLSLVFLLAAGTLLAVVGSWYLARRQQQAVPVATHPDAGTLLRGQIREMPRGLPVGSQAPEFVLQSTKGMVSLADLRQPGLPVALLFLDPGCGDCTDLLPHVHKWQREHAHTITFAIVSRGGEERNRPKFGAPGLPTLLLQQRDEVAQQLGTWIMPSAVIVRADGRIWSRIAIGSGDIQHLVLKVIARVTIAQRRGSGALSDRA